MDIPTLLNQLGFTRSGYYYCSRGGLDYQSSHGGYWPHTSFGKSNAYDLGFFSTALYPRTNSSRGDGFLLRCLAR